MKTKKFISIPTIKAQLGLKIFDRIRSAGDWFIHNIPLSGDPQVMSAPTINQDRLNARGYRNYNMHKYKKSNTYQCAEYAHQQLRNKGAEIHGHAWNSNTTPLFDGYKGLKRPDKFDYEQVINYNLDAADNLKKKLNVSKLNPKQTYSVSLYYNPSPYQRQAYKEGTNKRANTHTGNLFYDGNQWVIEHNYHGTIMFSIKIHRKSDKHNKI